MANSKFDSKSFNAEAFKYMVGRVPNLTMNEIKKSRALSGNPDIRSTFTSQNGTAYARLAMRGLIDGNAVNYDGQTDITATSTKTFEQGVVVVGRAQSWSEKDFSYDITGGVDFMGNIAEQIAQYKDSLDQKTILAVLKGIFSMTGTKNLEFVNAHTTDVTAEGSGVMSATTLNSATNKACGANKKKFTLVFMHSDVSTGLENLNLIERLKYTDSNGIQRSLDLGTWNGKLVIVDDDMPVEEGFFDSVQGADGALKIVADSASPTTGEIKLSEVTNYFGSKTLAAGMFVTKGARYTTYVLGDGAIFYEDIGAKVPYSMARDEKTDGGVDILYIRQRKVFAPFGISYEKTSQASLSPEDAELENGANWSLIHSGESSEGDRSYINHKAIPIARIFSRG
ncbi:MAG: phage coat protein [Clostridiales bacterium]|nr:phage coat protein [Clostridiales bacterium]MDY5702368.1 phage coat protein [Eubacteriales bacterium]MDY5755512.1 phage coat protein [Eubacteriales bacterium]